MEKEKTMSGAASASFLLQKWKEDTIGNKEGASLQLFGLVTMVFFTQFLIVHRFLFMPNQQHGTDIENLTNCDTFLRIIRGKIFFFFKFGRSRKREKKKRKKKRPTISYLTAVLFFFSGSIVPEHTARSPERRTFSFVHIHQDNGNSTIFFFFCFVSYCLCPLFIFFEFLYIVHVCFVTLLSSFPYLSTDC